MGSFTFRRAADVNEPTPLLIGIAGGTGSGKTFSALRLARGMVGPKGRIAFIDTENKRSLHYRNDFEFEFADLKPPYTPARYLEAVQAAEKQGFAVIVIDSWSHIWSGDGGVHDMQEAALAKMIGDKHWLAEKLSALAWSEPKGELKTTMTKLLQVRAHLIFCLRAEQKLKIIKVMEDGKEKTKYVDAGWQPICEKHFMFEMTTSMMMTEEKPGYPIKIKMSDKMRAIFPPDQLVGETAGERLRIWSETQGAQIDTTVGKAAPISLTSNEGEKVNTPPKAAESDAPKPRTKGKLALHDFDGKASTEFDNAGDWLRAFGAKLGTFSSYAGAAAMWERNEDTFHRISKAANSKKNEVLIERCKAVGKLAFDKRTPPTEGPGPDPGSAARPTAGINATKAAAEIMGKIVRAGSLQLLSAIEHDYSAEILAISQANPDKHAEIMSALDGKRQHFRGAR
jgi:hypothetical protein